MTLANTDTIMRIARATDWNTVNTGATPIRSPHLNDSFGRSTRDRLPFPAPFNSRGAVPIGLAGGRRTTGAQLEYVLQPGSFHNERISDALMGADFGAETDTAITGATATAPASASDYGGTLTSTGDFTNVNTNDVIEWRGPSVESSNGGLWLVAEKVDNNSVKVAKRPSQVGNQELVTAASHTANLITDQTVFHANTMRTVTLEREQDSRYEYYQAGPTGLTVNVTNTQHVQVQYSWEAKSASQQTGSSQWAGETIPSETELNAASCRDHSFYTFLFAESGQEYCYAGTSSTYHGSEAAVTEFTFSHAPAAQLVEAQRSVDPLGVIAGARTTTLTVNAVAETSDGFPARQWNDRRFTFQHWVVPPAYLNGTTGATAYVFTVYGCRFDNIGDNPAGDGEGPVAYDLSATAGSGYGPGTANSDAHCSVTRSVIP